MSSIYMEYTYPKELEKAKQERWPVLIPIGTMEYHSTICPYGTDALIAIFKIVLDLFLKVVFSSLPLLFSCGLMTMFSVLFGLLFLL